MADQKQLGFLDDHAKLLAGRHGHYACAEAYFSLSGHYGQNPSLDQDPHLHSPHSACLLYGTDTGRDAFRPIPVFLGISVKKTKISNRQEKI